MENFRPSESDYAIGLLSAFDISGLLCLPNISTFSTPTQDAYRKLLQDLTHLEGDYIKARDTVYSETFNHE